MAVTRKTLKNAETALQRVKAFVAAGGDLKSQAATPVGLEFISAFADVAKQFGYEFAKPLKVTDFTKPDPTSQS